MPQVFYRKKFSYYLGEQRAIDDIVVRYTSLIPPTPTGTPNVTPSNTPTPNVTSTPTSTLPVTPTPTTTKTPTPTTTTTLTSTSTPTQTPTSTLPLTPTPTGTPTSTPISSPTPTPTATPNPICPQQLILSASTPGLLYGLYNRATISNIGTFDSVWYNGFDSTLNYGTAPDGNDYVAYSVNSGVDYTSLYAFFNTPASSMDWVISKSTGSTIFNGGVIGLSVLLSPDSITNDGTYYYPKSGPQQYNGGYIQYPAVCITPTPTGSPTPTPTTSNTPTPTTTLTGTPTPTPTLTPTATEPGGYKLQAENADFIQTEGGDNINIEH